MLDWAELGQIELGQEETNRLGHHHRANIGPDLLTLDWAFITQDLLNVTTSPDTAKVKEMQFQIAQLKERRKSQRRSRINKQTELRIQRAIFDRIS